MNGIIISIDPVIVHLGQLELRWYGLAIMMAVVAGILITAHRGKKRGIATEDIYSLALWLVLGGIIGARLFHVIEYWGYYISDLLQRWPFQQGGLPIWGALVWQFQGLAIWGALVGGGVAALAFARLKHIPAGRLFDVMVPGLLVAQMIGRLGCIVNGDAAGGVTSLPWAFIYTHPDAFIPASLFGQPTHPYPVYEIIWNGLALLFILRLGRNFKKDGLLFLSYLSLYALARFFLTFVRQEKIWFWGLQEAQVVALLVLLFSLVAMIYISRRRVPEEVA